MALFDPKLELEAKRRKLLAERLIKAGEQPLETQVVGGIAVKNSPFAALAKGLSAVGGAWAESKSVDQEKEAAVQRQELYKQAFDKLNTGDYNSASGILAQDPASMDSALKVMTGGLTAQDNARQQQMLALALAQYGAKVPTTNPVGSPLPNLGGLPQAPGGIPLAPLPSGSSTPANMPNGDPKLTPTSPEGSAFINSLSGAAAPPAVGPSGQPATPGVNAQGEKDLMYDPEAQGGSEAKPLYVNGLPVTDGAPSGYQWGTKADGTRVAMKIQGANTAGVEGLNAVSTDVIKAYLDLNDKGGAVNLKDPPLVKAGNAIAASGAGQFMGKRLATANQSDRNRINQKRTLLINAIRQATGMTAKQMDSNAEMRLWLDSATNPELDIQSQVEAIKSIVKATGGELKLDPETEARLQKAINVPKPEGDFMTTPSGEQYRILK